MRDEGAQARDAATLAGGDAGRANMPRPSAGPQRLAFRLALAACTALFAPRALAQLSPNAAPIGGTVSSGQASIRNTGGTTLIQQSSQNAVVNWQSYNVGSNQTVQYAQPDSGAFTLNRVISSAPSQIAGHIIANGRIAIVNQSGVVFLKGSSVDTSGLVVSAAGITDKDFMAGRLVFSQPAKPGAIISNAGNITIRQAGLAALVAPQVVNSGTITAQLGHVILAGATTHTIDMYGDGLVTLNITGQVTTVSLGGKSVPALVTNIGTILAPGGSVVLTAQAADGVVTKAVSVAGTIAAPTMGAQTGQVLVQGIGGDVEIDGTVAATGVGPGTKGGQVEITGDHTVTVARGAVVDASGGAGGGTVSIGSRIGQGGGGAPPQVIAANTVIAAGARVHANATILGHGGHVTITAIGQVTLAGDVAARGGARAGNGGNVTIAARTVNAAVGVDTGVANGSAGTLQLDLTGNQIVQSTCNGAAGCVNYALFAQQTQSQTGFTVTDGSIIFDDTANPFVHSINVNLTTVGSGDIIFEPGVLVAAAKINANAAGSIDVLGDVRSLGDAGAINVVAGGGITEDNGPNAPAGTLSTANLAILARGGDVELDSRQNAIVTLQASGASGTFTLRNGTGLTISGPLSAAGVDISAAGNLIDTGNVMATGGDIALTADGSIALGATLTASGVALDATAGSISETVSGAGRGLLHTDKLAASATGSLLLDNADNAIGTIGMVGAVQGLSTGSDMGQTLRLDTAGNLVIGANVSGSDIVLHAHGSITEANGTSVVASSGLGAPGTLALVADTGSLSLQGFTQSGLLLLDAGGFIDEGPGATGTIVAEQLAGAAGGAISLNGGANEIAAIAPATIDSLRLTLGGLNAGGALLLDDAGAMTLRNAAVGGTTVSLTLSGGSGTLAQVGGRLAAGGGDVTIDAATIVQSAGAVIDAARNVAISGGSLSQQGGSILAGETTSSGSITINLTGGLTQATSSDRIETLGTGPGAGGVTIVLNGGDLQQTAGLIASAGGAVAVTAAHGGIYLGGTIEAAAADAPLSLSAATTLGVSSGGTIASNGGTIALRADQFALSGSIDAGSGAVALDRYDAGALSLGGGSFGGDTYTDSFGGLGFGAVTAGTLVLGSTTAGAGVATTLFIAEPPAGSFRGLHALGLYSGGDIMEGSNVAIGNVGVFGAALGDISLTSAGNSISNIVGPGLIAGGAVHLVDAAGLNIDTGASITGGQGVYVTAAALTAAEGSTIAAPGHTVAIETTAGDLALGGSVQGATVVLAAQAANLVASGDIQAGTLAASAAGALVLADEANQIGTIAPVTVSDAALPGTLVLGGLFAGGDMSLRDATALNEAGATIAAGGNISMLLADGLTQDGASIISSTGGQISLDAAGGDLRLAGTVLAGRTGGVLLVADAGAIDDTGTVTTGTLAASAAGDLNIVGTANDIGAVAGLSVTDPNLGAPITASGLSAGGTLALADTASLSLGGAPVIGAHGVVLVLGDGVTQDSTGLVAALAGNLVIDATGGDVTAQGTLQAASMALLAANGNVVDQGTILAGTLAAAALGTGNLELTGANNVIGTIAPMNVSSSVLPGDMSLSGLLAGGAIDVRDSTSLAVGGPGLGAAVTGASVTLSVLDAGGAAGGVLTQTGGAITATAGSVVLQAAHVVQNGGAMLAAGDGTVHVAGDLSQAGGATVSAGSVTIDGALAQAGATLTTAGAVSIGGGLTQRDGMLVAGGGSVAGNVAQSDGAVMAVGNGPLHIGGALTQVDATLTAGGDVVVAGGLAQTRSTVQAGGSLTVASPTGLKQTASTLEGARGVLLDLAGGFTQDAASQITSNGGAVDILARSGNIDIGGMLRSGAAGAGGYSGAVGLDAMAGNVGGSGVFLTGTLAANAAGNLDFSNAANSIAAVAPGGAMPGAGALAGLTAGGDINVTDATGLALNSAEVRGTAVTVSAGGAVSQTGGRIDAAGAVHLGSAGGFTQAGNGTISGATGVFLDLGGDLLQTAGSMIESVAQAAGRPASAGSIVVDTPGDISLAGTLAAGQILLGGDGPARQVTWTGNTIETGTSIAPGRPNRNIGAPLSGAGQRGVFVNTYDFTQSGATTVQALPDAAWATVQISLAGRNGSIRFDRGSTSASGLIAPRAQLLLVLGRNGTASGTIDVAGLNIFTDSTDASGGDVRLTGLVDGAGGTATAGDAFIHPVASADYQINACPIQSINCVLLSPVIVPVGSPVVDAQAPVVHQRVDDDDLTLPNVAEADF